MFVLAGDYQRSFWFRLFSLPIFFKKMNSKKFLLTQGKLTSWGLHNSKFVGVPPVCKVLTSSNAGCIYDKLAQLGSLEMRWGKVKWRTESKIIGFMHQCLEREREWQRETDFCSWPWARSFLLTYMYIFAAKKKKKRKHGDNSNHQISLNLLQARRKLCTRKTWILLLAVLETEYRSFYALMRMMQLLSTDDLFFYGSEEKDQSNLGEVHCTWPQEGTEKKKKLSSVWEGI